MNTKKIIKWILLIIWMIIIFLFSHQAYSGEATHGVLEVIFPSLVKNNNIDILNFIVRKAAHITENLILTILIILILKEYTKETKTIILLSIIICFSYACTDEFHQAFIPGRTSLFKDVLIDTIGGLIACILYKILKKISRKT